MNVDNRPGQHLIYNIFQVDQRRPMLKQALLLVQIQLEKELSRRRSNVNSEHYSHHFLLFLLLTLNREMFTGIASSDCDTISI